MVGSYVNCIVILKKTTQLSSRMAAPFYIPRAVSERFGFSASLMAFGGVFLFSPPDRCVVIAHCGFSVQFPNSWYFWIFFRTFICHLYILLVTSLFMSFALFWLGISPHRWVLRIFDISRYLCFLLLDMWLHVFSPSLWLALKKKKIYYKFFGRVKVFYFVEVQFINFFFHSICFFQL